MTEQGWPLLGSWAGGGVRGQVWGYRLPGGGPGILREVDGLLLLEEQEGKAVEARAPGREGGQVGTRLLSFSHPVAWDVGSGRRKGSC